MANKVFNTRLQQKRATQAQWEAASGFIPLAGEIIIYEPDSNYNYPRMKVGDGVHTIAALPFVTTTVNGNIGAINLTAQDVGADEEGSAAAALGVAREEIEAIPQSDWNENDETSKAYVANRTHWVETTEILPETIVEQPIGDDTNEWPFITPFTVIPEIGKTYCVNWNGTKYDCNTQGFTMDGLIMPVLGNLDIIQGTGDNGLPFAILVVPAEMTEELGIHAVVCPLDGSTNSVTLAIQQENIHKLSSKFINTPDWEAKQETEGIILNRTHWVEYNDLEECLPLMTLTFSDGMYPITTAFTKLPTKDDKYVVNYNGTDYETFAYSYNSPDTANMIILGDPSSLGIGITSERKEPFIIVAAASLTDAQTMGAYGAVTPLDNASSVTISINRKIGVYHKIDKRYLPEQKTSNWEAELNEEGHILNRTHYEESPLIPEENFTNLKLGNNNSGNYLITTIRGPELYPHLEELNVDDDVIVYWNDVKYYTKVRSSIDASYIIGNGRIEGNSDAPNSGEPFCISRYPKEIQTMGMFPNITILTNDTTLTTIKLKVTKLNPAIKKLDTKYLPSYSWSSSSVEDGFIKNRTHFEQNEEITIINISSSAFNFGEDGQNIYITGLLEPPINKMEVGEIYTVRWAGKEYQLVAKYGELLDGALQIVYIGDPSLVLYSPASELPHDNVGFCVVYYADHLVKTSKAYGAFGIFTEKVDLTSDSLYVGIPAGYVKQLDPKYILTAEETEILAMMLEEEALPVVQTEDGFVLCSAENEILMI